MHHFLLTLSHLLGINDEGTWYNFWSGIGSDLGEVTIVLAVVHHLRDTRKQRNQHHEQLKRHIDYKFTKLTDEETK